MIYYVEDEKNIRELVNMHCLQMDLRFAVLQMVCHSGRVLRWEEKNPGDPL